MSKIINYQMDLFIRDRLLMVNLMVKVFLNIIINIGMKGVLLKVLKMVMVSIIIRMVNFIQEIGLIIKSKGMVYISMTIIRDMKVSSKTT